MLRAALDGRRIHARGDVRFRGPTRRSFRPDDPEAEMRAFLEDAGYLHIPGLFTEAEADELTLRLIDEQVGPALSREIGEFELSAAPRDKQLV